MEKILLEYHGLETLGVLLVLNVLAMVGKFLFKLFDKKNDQAESRQKNITEKTQRLAEKMATLTGSMDHLQNVISSYMETTIGFASKLGAVEKQLINTAENLSEMERQISKIADYDDEMRKFMNAIRWLAGPRWAELKETILKDDYRS